jgi:hypothetical protein
VKALAIVALHTSDLHEAGLLAGGYPPDLCDVLASAVLEPACDELASRGRLALQLSGITSLNSDVITVPGMAMPATGGKVYKCVRTRKIIIA